MLPSPFCPLLTKNDEKFSSRLPLYGFCRVCFEQPHPEWPLSVDYQPKPPRQSESRQSRQYAPFQEIPSIARLCALRPQPLLAAAHSARFLIPYSPLLPPSSNFVSAAPPCGAIEFWTKPKSPPHMLNYNCVFVWVRSRYLFPPRFKIAITNLI